MTTPHIKSSWLYNGQMMVLVLFPNGVEKVMLRKRFMDLMKNELVSG
jgi:hypothetical protein